jgi:signal transduction histidine kinase
MSVNYYQKNSIHLVMGLMMCKNSTYMDIQLASLNDTKNALMQCKNVDSVVDMALGQVQEKLLAQVVSVFLFTKDGLVKRIGISGLDKNQQRFGNSWFPDEKYNPGESFSAKAVPPSAIEKGYGKAIVSNKLHDFEMTANTKALYLDKLGELKHGISIPLSGRNRTFGTIEVINKVKPEGGFDDDGFSREDVYWLMSIGNSLATIISACRHSSEFQVFADLSQKLMEWNSTDNSYDVQGFYNSIVSSLTRECLPYKACILRRVNDGYLEVVAIAAPGIKVEDRNDEKRKPEGLLGEVFSTKKPRIVLNISSSDLEYFNIKWIEKNGLVSHACYPLIARNKCVGTISVFTSYEHKFYDNDKSFLQTTAFLASSFINRINLEDELGKTKGELRIERDVIIKAAHSTSDSTEVNAFINEISHRYKHELVGFQELLKQIGESSSQSKRQSLVDHHVGLIKSRISEISKGFVPGSLEEVDINKSLRRTVNLVKQEAPRDLNIDFIEEYGDDLSRVLINSVEIESVFYNILINAVRAIAHSGNRGNGRINISTGSIYEGKAKNSFGNIEDITRLQVIIGDNGVGIPRDLTEKIFQRGFTTDAKEGSGIGLFTSSQVIKNYGGAIDVSSQVGQGTTFFITIPVDGG